MKKIISSLIILVMIISSFCVTSFAQDEIKILINGIELVTDQAPVIENGRTLVPVRAIFEGIGATVTWDEATRTAIGQKDGKEIKVTIDNTTAYIGNTPVTLDVPARIINSRTMVPVRFISESLGLKVDWEANSRTVIITNGQNAISKKWIFDDLTAFENNKDYIVGGGYDVSGVSLSADFDHTLGNGKSLKMAGRAKNDHRLKIKDVFTPEMLGKKFEISAYVYSPNIEGTVNVGCYGDVGTAYAFKAADNKHETAKKGQWVNVKFEYEHKDAIITQLGFEQRSTSSPLVDTMYIDDVTVTEITENKEPEKEETVKASSTEWNFDNITEFKVNTDFIAAGGYSADNVSISADFDHTSGNGKSLKMAGRAKNDHRLKIKKAFTPEMVGKKFVISAYVYSPNVEGTVNVGCYSDAGLTYAYKPIESKHETTKKGQWTLVTFTYTHNDATITQLGFEQRSTTSPLVDTMYIDDITIVETKEETPSVAYAVNGHRPVPTEFTTGKSYEDLIFFKVGGEKTNEELIASLPAGKTVVNEDALFSVVDKVKGKDTNATAEIIDVEGMPFTKAVRANIFKMPEKNAYDVQFDLGDPLLNKAKAGDVMLLKVYMRCISGGQADTYAGKIQMIVEQDVSPFDKTVVGDVINGADWKVFYFPFTYNEAKCRHATVRLGYYVQTVDIGGYEIINYGNDGIELSDLPTNRGTDPSLEKDAAWRREAWDRIEKIRKGDIKVIVKDANGNIIPNAKVDVNMYEHEFQFGTAVHDGLINNDIYKSVVQKNFNSAVLENETKWVTYEKNPALAKSILGEAQKLGLKYFRGHPLFWDRNVEDENGNWKENTSVPKRLFEAYGDKDKAQAIIKEHIDKITEEFRPYFTEWDVINEAYHRRVLQDMYGRGLLKEWYDMARNALGKDAKLYYNDGVRGKMLIDILDVLEENNVDYDGIGLQSHYATVEPITNILVSYDELYQKYGKRIKITEYDFITNDFNVQGNFTRDILIASFSHEAVDGFIMWGFKGGTGDRYVLYDKDWNAKPALEIWQDLIYNKWWTCESGVTDANGAYALRGFYGDYDITASANGKTKTVSVSCHKGNDNTVVITLD